MEWWPGEAVRERDLEPRWHQNPMRRVQCRLNNSCPRGDLSFSMHFSSRISWAWQHHMPSWYVHMCWLIWCTPYIFSSFNSSMDGKQTSKRYLHVRIDQIMHYLCTSASNSKKRQVRLPCWTSTIVPIYILSWHDCCSKRSHNMLATLHKETTNKQVRQPATCD
jgi:hypothetical protein